jgi:hypothetical protein
LGREGEGEQSQYHTSKDMLGHISHNALPPVSRPSGACQRTGSGTMYLTTVRPSKPAGYRTARSRVFLANRRPYARAEIVYRVPSHSIEGVHRVPLIELHWSVVVRAPRGLGPNSTTATSDCRLSYTLYFLMGCRVARSCTSRKVCYARERIRLFHARIAW